MVTCMKYHDYPVLPHTRFENTLDTDYIEIAPKFPEKQEKPKIQKQGKA